MKIAAVACIAGSSRLSASEPSATACEPTARRLPLRGDSVVACPDPCPATSWRRWSWPVAPRGLFIFRLLDMTLTPPRSAERRP